MCCKKKKTYQLLANPTVTALENKAEPSTSLPLRLSDNLHPPYTCPHLVRPSPSSRGLHLLSIPPLSASKTRRPNTPLSSRRSSKRSTTRAWDHAPPSSSLSPPRQSKIPPDAVVANRLNPEYRRIRSGLGETQRRRSSER